MVVGMQPQQQHRLACPAASPLDAVTPCSVVVTSLTATATATSSGNDRTSIIAAVADNANAFKFSAPTSTTATATTSSGVANSTAALATSIQITTEENERRQIAADHIVKTNVDSTTTSQQSSVPLANNGGGKNRVKLTDVNPHLICVLCHGYFVDATTIAECLHSFCRSCILLYLQSEDNCPKCEGPINKSLKPDKTLQDIVYKLVPGLFHSEMKRRHKFYQSCPKRDLHLHPEYRGITVDRLVYSLEDTVCVALEYYDTDREKAEWQIVGSYRINNNSGCLASIDNKSRFEEYSKNKNLSKKFLQCPASFRIINLKKLISLKYNLNSHHVVEIFYRRETLPDEYSLMDIAYIYTWKRSTAMSLYYRIHVPVVMPRVPRCSPNPESRLTSLPSSLLSSSVSDKTEHIPIADNFATVKNNSSAAKSCITELLPPENMKKPENSSNLLKINNQSSSKNINIKSTISSDQKTQNNRIFFTKTGNNRSVTLGMKPLMLPKNSIENSYLQFKLPQTTTTSTIRPSNAITTSADVSSVSTIDGTITKNIIAKSNTVSALSSSCTTNNRTIGSTITTKTISPTTTTLTNGIVSLSKKSSTPSISLTTTLNTFSTHFTTTTTDSILVNKTPTTTAPRSNTTTIVSSTVSTNTAVTSTNTAITSTTVVSSSAISVSSAVSLNRKINNANITNTVSTPSTIVPINRKINAVTTNKVTVSMPSTTTVPTNRTAIPIATIVSTPSSVINVTSSANTSVFSSNNLMMSKIINFTNTINNRISVSNTSITTTTNTTKPTAISSSGTSTNVDHSKPTKSNLCVSPNLISSTKISTTKQLQTPMTITNSVYSSSVCLSPSFYGGVVTTSNDLSVTTTTSSNSTMEQPSAIQTCLKTNAAVTDTITDTINSVINSGLSSSTITSQSSKTTLKMTTVCSDNKKELFEQLSPIINLKRLVDLPQYMNNTNKKNKINNNNNKADKEQRDSEAGAAINKTGSNQIATTISETAAASAAVKMQNLRKSSYLVNNLLNKEPAVANRDEIPFLPNNEITVSATDSRMKKLNTTIQDIHPEVSIILNRCSSSSELKNKLNPETSYDVSCFSTIDDSTKPSTPKIENQNTNFLQSPTKITANDIKSNETTLLSVPIIRNTTTPIAVKLNNSSIISTNRQRNPQKRTASPPSSLIIDEKKPRLNNNNASPPLLPTSNLSEKSTTIIIPDLENNSTDNKLTTIEKPQPENSAMTIKKMKTKNQTIPALIQINNAAPFMKFMNAKKMKKDSMSLNHTKKCSTTNPVTTHNALDLSSPFNKSPNFDEKSSYKSMPPHSSSPEQNKAPPTAAHKFVFSKTPSSFRNKTADSGIRLSTYHPHLMPTYRYSAAPSDPYPVLQQHFEEQQNMVKLAMDRMLKAEAGPITNGTNSAIINNNNNNDQAENFLNLAIAAGYGALPYHPLLYQHIPNVSSLSNCKSKSPTGNNNNNTHEK